MNELNHMAMMYDDNKQAYGMDIFTTNSGKTYHIVNDDKNLTNVRNIIMHIIVINQ